MQALILEKKNPVCATGLRLRSSSERLSVHPCRLEPSFIIARLFCRPAQAKDHRVLNPPLPSPKAVELNRIFGSADSQLADVT